MKKLVYLLTAFFAITLTSCEDPMEDIHNEIDAKTTTIITGDVAFTMSDDDYDFLELNYGNFNNVDDAKTMIPGLLSDKYPVWGKSSSALVTFNVYSPLRTERSLARYTVTTADYDANPDTARFNNFDDEDQIYTFLDTKYENPSDRFLVSLTYKFYNGSVSTLNNGFLYSNDTWNFIQGFTDDEYEEVRVIQTFLLKKRLKRKYQPILKKNISLKIEVLVTLKALCINYIQLMLTILMETEVQMTEPLTAM